MFTEKDIIRFEKKGITVQQVENQIETFRKGFPFAEITKPASPGDGLLVLDKKLQEDLIVRYQAESKDLSVTKFVPASGAASRMFKDLFSILEKLHQAPESIHALLNDSSNTSLGTFISRLTDFAFGSELLGLVADHKDKNSAAYYRTLLSTFLHEEGLNYGGLPKGLLKFHHSDNEIRTAFEEHLVEGAMYAKSSSNEVNIHFTVSPEHLDGFKELSEKVVEKYAQRFNVEYNLSFSFQKSSTDTVAVDLNNEPFRNSQGEILFRPGGHGALIENLNEIDSGLIFIKNIDNVIPDKLKSVTVRYKSALAGLLLLYRDRIFSYLNEIQIPMSHIHEQKIDEIIDFIETDLCFISGKNIRSKSKEEKVVFALETLNRPIRVCGMVKNEGEPGGGPFWVQHSDGTLSLQVIEASQINLKEKSDIVKQATHFNPVDLICYVYDFRGNKFNLPDFIDPETGFISEKSSDGRDLKALELPGLWNGAMAKWNTIFVEVPITTFNPVKTVFDLLRPEHQ